MAAAFDALLERLGDRVLGTDDFGGDLKVLVAPGDWVEAATCLRDEAGLSMLVALTGADRGVDTDPRFEVLGVFLDPETAERVHVTTAVPEADPVCPTLTGLFASSNWFEREVYDMYGVTFEGHPDLRRILMWDDYEHHPLRKEFPVEGVGTMAAPRVAERHLASLAARTAEAEEEE